MDPTANSAAPPPLDTPPPPRRRRRRWLRWIAAVVAVCAVLLLLLVLSFDAIVRGIARGRIEKATGMKTELGRLEVRFLKPSLRVEGFRLFNPAEFGGGKFLDIPELTVAVDREALSDEKLHVNLARLDIAEINVAVSQDGRTNFVELKKRLDEQKAGQEAKTRARKRPKAQPQFAGIDRFEFSFDTLRYTSLLDPDQSRTVKFGLRDMVVKDARTQEEFGAKLVIELLAKGVNVLELIVGGIENLPQAETR